jgi:pimeloyl-ACP methyl ester carboxylesterase
VKEQCGTNELADGSCPIPIIRAEFSDRFAAANGERACAAAPDCRMVAMPGVTHFAPMKQPEAAALSALDLLDDIAPTGPMDRSRPRQATI